MHEIQQSLLNTLQERGLKQLPPLRKLAELAGKKISAQQVKHHLEQLQKKGFLLINKKTSEISFASRTVNLQAKSSIVTLPIYGTANCGPALSIAEQRPEGFLKISSSLLNNKKTNDLFVVKASGDSMNRASIENKKIEDGDYLVVDSSKLNLKGKGEIVLSIIDGAANVKRLFKSEDGYVLMPESSKEYSPIYIHEDDQFSINGTVINVLKKPKLN